MWTPFLTQALTHASSIATTNFGKVSGTIKPDDNNQVLTETDIAIGKLLVELVQKEYPDHNIIDEEAGVIDKGSAYTWVIDPIDGTSNFANGIPLYGIMIGLLENDSPIAGGVVLPAFQELYTAEKGKGAFCNGQKISVTTETNLLNCLVAYGIDGHQENPQLTYEESKTLAQIILNIRNLRTSNSAYDMMLVARGRYGSYLNRTTKIWDNIAPHIIIEEAGALYTDFSGQPMDYSNHLKRSKDNFTVCAAAPAIHEALQKIIHSAPWEY